MVSEVNPPCLHKQTDHQCGTNARYVLDGCRCADCGAARKAADRRRIKYNAGITRHPMVDAGPVREHCEMLMAAGMGPKRIAVVSGVPHGAVSKLIYGDYTRGMAPSRRLRRETAIKLLWTRLDVADGAKVPAGEAKRIVRELVRRGWTKAEIGRRVSGPQAVALQAVNFRTVLAGTLRTLRALMEEPVPLRVHSPTGKMYQPNPDHRHRRVTPTTPGVPVVEYETVGTLRCEVCGGLVADHSTTGCWRELEAVS
jgi:hypothetical protein